jgi:hypothetical protein
LSLSFDRRTVTAQFYRYIDKNGDRALPMISTVPADQIPNIRKYKEPKRPGAFLKETVER